MRRKSIFFCCLSLAVILSGCSSSPAVRPEITPQPIGDFRISAKVLFEGNREYLPLVLKDEAGSNAGVSIDYRYEVSHTNTDFDAIALFNPLSIVGFPGGYNQLTIVSELKILRNGTPVKNYRAACAIEQQTGLWSFKTVTDMRREGLIALRDNIDTQLLHDRQFIESELLKH